ncbi:MAG: hypothetical protein VKL41_22620 [Snowella sp.]|nr:hypothetical protein [Snowella sp.]
MWCLISVKTLDRDQSPSSEVRSPSYSKFSSIMRYRQTIKTLPTMGLMMYLSSGFNRELLSLYKKCDRPLT